MYWRLWEISNIKIVKLICSIMDEKFPNNANHSDLIKFVQDRPGHDRRYAINSNKIKKELGWAPIYDLKKGLNKTIDWYLDNKIWLFNKFKESEYKGGRLGLLS